MLKGIFEFFNKVLSHFKFWIFHYIVFLTIGIALYHFFINELPEYIIYSHLSLMCLAVGINTIKNEDKKLGYTYIGLALFVIFIVIN